MNTITLCNTQPGHDKVYHLEVVPHGELFMVKAHYGARGKYLKETVKTKEPVSQKEALWIFQEVVREKYRHGYTVDSAAASPLEGGAA